MTAPTRNTYAVEQRLRLIDFLLHHYGQINRGALMDYFGISMPQASMDLRNYFALAPSNATYSKSLKTYLKSASFKRVYS